MLDLSGLGLDKKWKQCMKKGVRKQNSHSLAILLKKSIERKKGEQKRERTY
jgi:hypothetical protein